VLSKGIWLLGLLSEVALLSRAILQRIWPRYPFFYAYIAASLVGTTGVSMVSFLTPNSYARWYWIVQFVTLLLGCGIVLEVFNRVLAPYFGAARFARVVILTGFAVIFCFAIIYSFANLHWTASSAEFELERDLRTLQAIFLGAIIVLISYYRIQIGKNIRGMVLGYALYVVASLASFALRAYAGRSFNAWMFIPPLSFDACLAIWLAALWSYHANPVPSSGVHLEADYESLVAFTKAAVGTVRSQLGRTVRP
jgi:hypothetical protein